MMSTNTSPSARACRERLAIEREGSQRADDRRTGRARSATIAEFPAGRAGSPSSISFAYQSVVNPRQVSDERESLNETAI